ncbi:MAG: hypothetical protein LBK29_01020 [Oscillospiraceae bacterium]|nr:hypothetical protein [Oscillospiraceae bacterium]
MMLNFSKISVIMALIIFIFPLNERCLALDSQKLGQDKDNSMLNSLDEQKLEDFSENVLVPVKTDPEINKLRQLMKSMSILTIVGFIVPLLVALNKLWLFTNPNRSKSAADADNRIQIFASSVNCISSFTTSVLSYRLRLGSITISSVINGLCAILRILCHFNCLNSHKFFDGRFCTSLFVFPFCISLLIGEFTYLEIRNKNSNDIFIENSKQKGVPKS